MKFSTTCIIFIVFIIFSSLLPAQSNQVTVSGFIRDASSGERLLGVNMLLYKDSLNLKEPPLRGTSSNNHGFFAIPKLGKGKYVLVVSSLGYKTKVVDLNITIDQGKMSLNVDLEQQDVELDEVIVKGIKENRTDISTVDISPEVLQQLPSISGEVDVFKSLQTVAGVKTATEISSGLYVRGGSPDQTLTLVDGIMIYNPTHLGNFASTFNSSAIQNISLIKGAFPAEYGGRLSSVLDIKLRAGTKEKDKRKLGLGIVNSYLMLEGPLRENSTYMVFGRMMYYDAIQKQLGKNNSIPRYNFKDLNTKLTYTLSESNVLSVSGMLTYDDLYSPPDNEDIKYDIGWENKTISLNWLKIGSNSLFLHNSVSYINYKFRSLLRDKSSEGSSSDYFASSNLDDFLIKTNADIYWNEDHILKVGGELAIHFYDLLYSDIYDPLVERDDKYNNELFATEAAMYIQNDWNVFEGLKANFGGRVYFFNNSKYLNFEPRLSLSYKVTPYLSIKSAYAIAHQFLHLIVRNDISLPTDLWYPSTSKIEPSRSTQYIFGIESEFMDGEYLLSAETYYKDMKNLYEFQEGASLSTNNSIEDLFTKGKGEAYGVEFFLNKRIGDLTGWIGYTLSWTRRKFDDLNIGRIFYPRYDRRHDISVVLAYKLFKNFNISSTWVYSTGQGYTIPTSQYKFRTPALGTDRLLQFDYTDRNAFRMPAYHKLDLSFQYSFKYGNIPLQAYVSLLNVYNRKNAFGYYLNPEEIDESTSDKIIKMKQITLFPFIPSVGINVEF